MARRLARREYGGACRQGVCATAGAGFDACQGRRYGAAQS
jgi:hypothetical protein